MRHDVLDGGRSAIRKAADTAISEQEYDVEAIYDVWYNEDSASRHRKHKLDIYIPVPRGRSCQQLAAQSSGRSSAESAAPLQGGTAADTAVTSPLHGATASSTSCSNSTTARPWPVVVFVHGGGWKKGGRRTVGGMHGNVGRSLASRGFLTVVPSYRLSSVGLKVMIPLYVLASTVIGLVALAGLAAAGAARGVSCSNAGGGAGQGQGSGPCPSTTAEGMAAVASARPGVTAAVFVVPMALFLALQLVYRSSGNATWPTHAHDTAMAVAWTARHCGAYGGDSARMALVGHSSGGHIVAMLALQPQRFLAPAGLPQPWRHIKAVAVCSGVLSGRLLLGAEPTHHLQASKASDVDVGAAAGTGSSSSDDGHTAARPYVPPPRPNVLSRLFRRGMYHHSVFGRGSTVESLGPEFPVEALAGGHTCVTAWGQGRDSSGNAGAPRDKGTDASTVITPAATAAEAGVSVEVAEDGASATHATDGGVGTGAGAMPVPVSTTATDTARTAGTSPLEPASVSNSTTSHPWGALPFPPLLLVNASPGRDWTLETHTDALQWLLEQEGLDGSVGEVLRAGGRRSVVQPEAACGSETRPSMQGPGSSPAAQTPLSPAQFTAVQRPSPPLVTPAQLSCPLVTRATLMGTDHVGYILGMGSGVACRTAGRGASLPAVSGAAGASPSSSSSSLPAGPTPPTASFAAPRTPPWAVPTVGEHVFAPYLAAWLRLHTDGPSLPG